MLREIYTHHIVSVGIENRFYISKNRRFDKTRISILLIDSCVRILILIFKRKNTRKRTQFGTLLRTHPNCTHTVCEY